MSTENHPQTQAQEQPKETPKSSALTALQDNLAKLATPEEKIRVCLDFMKASLTEGKAPRFKDFWESKRLCLPFFKEALPPASRTILWSAYIEISTEARRIKEVLDEQSTFATEQIDLAIGALEKDLENYTAQLEQLSPYGLPESSSLLRHKKEFYNGLQRELYLLNTFASRVNGLRKEVMKTEMRIRFKNRFFERLSQAGDKVFPKRKELIKQLSAEFAQDVAAFVQQHFESSGKGKESLFDLRDEIKALQELAKNLTLDTHSFTETRLQLSKCWDALKEKEKEHKKEEVERKQATQKNVQAVLERIKGLAEKCAQEGCTAEEAEKHSGDILTFMRNFSLSRDEVKFLKGEIQKAQQPIFEREKKAQEEKARHFEEAQRQRKEKLGTLKEEIAGVIERSETLSVEELVQAQESYVKQVKTLNLSSTEKRTFDEVFKSLRDRILEKKETAMKNLSQDAQASLEQLESLLEERQHQRKEIRALIEGYSKELAGSSFDFEKAMYLNELIQTEKTRLEKVMEAMEEIEGKIADLIE